VACKNLHEAAAAGDVKCVEQLLREGANPNARDKKYGATPLHWAALWGHADVAEVLLRYRANPNARDKEGKSPLDVARERGFDNIVGDFI